MKICLGKEIEEIKKKNSEAEKNLLKNRNSENVNELDENDIYIRRNTIKNIKLGTQVVYRIYLNHNIVYELKDTIIASKFHALVPAATATSIIFDKLENQDITSYNLAGYCDINNHIAVYNNNTEYFVLNIRNAGIYAPLSCHRFFYEYRALSNCVFHNFNTDYVSSMSFMFFRCDILPSLDISSFNTSNVNNMASMFSNCYHLRSLDISSFNTYNVNNMNYMFNTCNSLTTIISNTFSLLSSPTSNSMFLFCDTLVGGNGTTYDANHIDAEYARIDGENGLPGYFTAPAANK